MAHTIIDMDACLGAMAGNASTGKLVELKAAYHAVDANLANIEEGKRADAHELLETIQQWLCSGGIFQGAATQTQSFIDSCSAYV